MRTLVAAPTRITAAGNKPKLIDEFVGRVNNSESRLSIADMRPASGWVEPGQTPAFATNSPSRPPRRLNG